MAARCQGNEEGNYHRDNDIVQFQWNRTKITRQQSNRPAQSVFRTRTDRAQTKHRLSVYVCLCLLANEQTNKRVNELKCLSYFSLPFLMNVRILRPAFIHHSAATTANEETGSQVPTRRSAVDQLNGRIDRLAGRASRPQRYQSIHI